MKYEPAKMTVCEPVQYIPGPEKSGRYYYLLPLVEPGMVMRMLKHEILKSKKHPGYIDYPGAASVIAQVPMLECEPVRHEKWLDVENKDGHSSIEIRYGDLIWKNRICTGCGNETMALSSYRRCPYCGAHMGGEEEYMTPLHVLWRTYERRKE